LFYLSSRDSIGVHAKKSTIFLKLLLLDIALFEQAPHFIVNVNKPIKKKAPQGYFFISTK
jgi:hypothetical protein